MAQGDLIIIDALTAERAKVAALTAALEVVGDMRNSHLAARDCTWEGDRMYAVNPFIFERILRCASDALALAGTATDARLRSHATDGLPPAATTAQAAPTDGRNAGCSCNGEGKCGYCAEEAVCRAEFYGDAREEREL
jgi:hypothetical protein